MNLEAKVAMRKSQWKHFPKVGDISPYSPRSFQPCPSYLAHSATCLASTLDASPRQIIKY